MAKFTYSELFLSQEGEAKYTAKPTVYARFTNCNFTCNNFNNPDKLNAVDPEVLGFNPKDIIAVGDIPEITIGCDSQYSWDRQYRHMWKTVQTEELIASLTDLLPKRAWTHPVTGNDVMFSITGGEPTLLQKTLPHLINHPDIAGCNHMLIETNCSLDLRPAFIEAIAEWLSANPARRWTWSNSPKLSTSGEAWEEAIRPEVALAQYQLVKDFPNQCDQYFKFVCGIDPLDYEEVMKAMNEYWDAGVDRLSNQIWVMPEACTGQQQKEIQTQVAELCLEEGYMFCFRLQNEIYSNAIGK